MKSKISFLGIAILILIISVSCNSQSNSNDNNQIAEKEIIVKEASNEIVSAPAKDAKLKSSYVCYVNNSYFGKEQIPVEVDGKTYYGCCEGCVDKLHNIREFRYATDPLSGVEVDKAKAYIVLKPDGNGEVLYFENKDNYLKFI